MNTNGEDVVVRYRKEKCEECGIVMEVSDWPFCPHGSTAGRRAQMAPPTVVFRNQKGEYRFPGRDTDRPPRGFQRVELSTQRSRDKFEKEYGGQQTAKIREIEYLEKAAWEQTFREHEPALRAIKDNSQSAYTKNFVDVCFADAKKRMEKSSGKSESEFRIESNHMNAQNRMPWQDRDTGWKPRR